MFAIFLCIYDLVLSLLLVLLTGDLSPIQLQVQGRGKWGLYDFAPRAILIFGQLRFLFIVFNL